MECRFSDLRRKEVISVADGVKIGYIDDLILDKNGAKVVAFVIFSRFFLFGIFGKREDYIIPWEKIELIGEDAIIISCHAPKPPKKPKKRLFYREN